MYVQKTQYKLRLLVFKLLKAFSVYVHQYLLHIRIAKSYISHIVICESE
jgi:hypothetical protein